MAFILENYDNGFVIKDNQLDFDKDIYLKQYIGTDLYTFMSSITNTQMFEQFSRYRTYIELEKKNDMDEFDIEVKNIQQTKKVRQTKNNTKIYKMIEKPTNPPIEQVQTKVEISQTEQRIFDEPTSVVSTDELNSNQSSPQLDLLPSPIVLNEIRTPIISETPRQIPQIDSKIKRLQNELKYKIQTCDTKRLNPRDEYGEEQKEIKKKLVQIFNPINESNSVKFRSDINLIDRHPSIHEIIPKKLC